MEDRELLQRFAREGASDAFECLVTRYGNMVYGFCLRRLKNAAQAEDATQAVFIILARQAAKAAQHRVLSGWLFKTAHYACADVLKSERRRAQHEQSAGNSMLKKASSVNSNPDLRLILDEALASLGQNDRNALLLKYYQGHTVKEVGALMGVGEKAAEKRISRALLKMQIYFQQEAPTDASYSLLGLFAANSQFVVPAEIGRTLTASALASAKHVAVANASQAIAKGAMQMMFWSKMKTAATACIWIVVVLSVITFWARSEDGNNKPVPENLYLSPQQNLAMLTRAWKTTVGVHYEKMKLDDVLKDLATQSGIEIRIDPKLKPPANLPKDAHAGRVPRESNFTHGGLWVAAVGTSRGDYFLGKEKAAQFDSILNSIEFESVISDDVEIKHFTVEGKVPLAAVLEFLIRNSERQLSYHKDCILLSERESVAPELYVTRNFSLPAGAGGEYVEILNGERISIRHDAVDFTALNLARGGSSELSTLAMAPGKDHELYRELLKIRPHCEIKWDDARNILSVTADPDEMYYFVEQVLPKMNGIPPETVTALAKPEPDAPAVRQQRMAELARKAAPPSAADQKKYAEWVRNLDAPEFDQREAAEKALIQAGLPAIPAALNIEANASSELRTRASRVALKIYARGEVDSICKVTQAYTRVALALNFRTAYKDFWGQRRVKLFDESRAEFDFRRKATQSDPDAWKQFKRNWHFPDDAQPDAVTFDDAQVNSYGFKAVPEMVSVDEVSLGANVARCKVSYRYTDGGETKDRFETLTLCLENGAWKIDLTKSIPESDEIRWSKDGELHGVPFGMSVSEVQAIPGGLMGYASAYATSFSFFDF